MTQLFMLDSAGLRQETDMPSVLHSLIVWSHYGDPCATRMAKSSRLTFNLATFHARAHTHFQPANALFACRGFLDIRRTTA
jgi:hypothetical protein